MGQTLHVPPDPSQPTTGASRCHIRRPGVASGFPRGPGGRPGVGREEWWGFTRSRGHRTLPLAGAWSAWVCTGFVRLNRQRRADEQKDPQKVRSRQSTRETSVPQIRWRRARRAALSPGQMWERILERGNGAADRMDAQAAGARRGPRASPGSHAAPAPLPPGAGAATGNESPPSRSL